MPDHGDTVYLAKQIAYPHLLLSKKVHLNTKAIKVAAGELTVRKSMIKYKKAENSGLCGLLFIIEGAKKSL